MKRKKQMNFLIQSTKIVLFDIRNRVIAMKEKKKKKEVKLPIIQYNNRKQKKVMNVC
jgi:hypothetical protein